MIGQINRIAEIWWSWMGPMFWQVSLLIAFLGVVDYCLRKRLWPQIRYAMWLLVLVKLLLPPTFALPTGIVSRLHPSTDRPMAKQYEGSPTSSTLPPEEGFDRRDRGPKGYADPGEDPTPMESAVETSPSITTASGYPARLSWEAIAMAGWLMGGVMLTVWLAAGYARLSRIHCRQDSNDHVPEAFAQLLADTAQRLRLRRLPRVVVSQSVESPAVFGVFRPVLLLPARGAEDLSPREAEHILLHELAHLKRRDLQVHACCIALQVIYWFNPLLYLVRRQLQHLRELCCDATVAGILKEGTKDYCQTLLETAEWLLRKPRTCGIGFLGLVENPSRLFARLQWLQKGPSRHPRLRMATALLVGGLLSAFLLPMAQAKKSTDSLAKANSADFPIAESRSTSSPSQPASPPEEKTIPATTEDTSATGPGTATTATEKAPAAGVSDTIVDPNTGLKFTVAKKISAENDRIIHNNLLNLSPNGKFLLWRGWMTPLDGGKPFKPKAIDDVIEAAWSPDGKLIAYRSGLAIWLLPVAPDTGQPIGPARKLIDDPANWSYGVILWSADSEWIILCYSEQDKTRRIEKCVSVRDGKLIQAPDYTRFSLRSPDQKTLAYCRPGVSVWTTPVGGGATRLVAGNSGMAMVPLWWSPDSEWLLYAVAWRGHSYYDLRFVRLGDHREVALKFPEQARAVGSPAVGLGVSPDGRELQFFKNSHHMREALKVAPIRGGAFAEVAFARQFDYIDEELCTPEGQRLVFTGLDKQGKTALYVAPSAGDNPVEVKLNVSFDGDLFPWLVSPDGKRLFFEVNRGSRGGAALWDFYVIPISLDKAESTGPATLIFKDWQHPKGGVGGIAWSPDSSRLAIPAKGEDNGDLWVVPADGSPAKQLTQSPEEVEQSPTWSPDGKFIAYCVKASTGVGVSLYAIPAEGGTPKRLWTKSDSDRLPYTWFPDSKEVGLESDGTLVAVAIADGAVRPFLKLAQAGFTWIWWLQWSPDGQTLALWGGNEDGYLTALFRASDKKIETLPPDPTWKDALGWTGDSQAIFCLAQQPDRIRPAALVYEVDLVEAWTQARNRMAGASLPAIASPIAKLEAPPLVNGEFRDDFEDGDTKYWTFDDMEWQGPGRVREVRNGELALENTRAVLGQPDWTNYVVTVKMCIKQVLPTPRRGGSAAGIGFRKGEHGEYWLGAEPDRKDLGHEKDLWLGIIYRDADKRVHVGELAAPPYNFVADKWYTLQVEVKGPHIVARVDGQTIIDLSDESCPHGPVTLFSVEALAHFDDFSVRPLP
jgi:beta-lactamase regulating signal transducer with metallopeptidase domain/Tol biopolymer transport system component